MTVLFSLYLAFVQIGLFGFGGGYAMISLIQRVLEQNNWLDMERFIDIVAIAEMTPGPIAVNSATFVGFSVAGFIGALLATAGVITPSFILVLALAYLFRRTRELPAVTFILGFLRPVIIGLIISAAFTLGKFGIMDWKTLVIALGSLAALTRTRLHPLCILGVSAVAGIVLF